MSAKNKTKHLIVFDKNHCKVVDASQWLVVTMKHLVTVICQQALAASHKSGTVMVVGMYLHQKLLLLCGLLIFSHTVCAFNAYNRVAYKCNLY